LAELTANCETLRARAFAGEDIDANAITRLESTANRAERAVVNGAKLNDDDPVKALHDYLRQPAPEGDEE
jgi:hypothetical protein